jgi:hypothetical protein
MPIYTIETPSGKRLKIEAADESTAMRGAQEWESQQTAQPANPFEGKSEDEARAFISTLPEDKKADAYNTWADTYVAKEREQGGIGQAIDSGVRGLARGTLIGSWLDEANALTSGVGAALTGGSYDDAYNETVAYQRAKDRAFDKENPYTSTGLQIAGGLGSAVAAAPFVLGGSGASLGSNIVSGAKAGATAGGVYGAGLGEESLGSRAYEGAKGAVLGGAIGGVAPVVAAGVGNATRYLSDKFKSVPQALAPYERGAVSRLADVVGASEITPAGATRRLGELGDQAMLADLSRPLEDLSGAMAGTPMKGAQTIFNAVKGRGATAPERVTAGVDKALGGKQNVPKLLKSVDEFYKKQAGPLYEEFHNTPVPFTRELEGILDELRTASPDVLRDARRYAALDGMLGKGGTKQFFANFADDGTATITRVPNAVEWDYIKRALDGKAYGISVPENDKRIFSGISRLLKDNVDTALSPDDPANSIWAQARRVWSDNREIQDALEAGKMAFSKKLSPDEMAEEIAGMSEAGRKAYQIGARQTVRDAMGNASTKFGEAGDTAGMRMLGSEYAKEKVDLIAPGQSDELSRILNAEGRFAATEANVLQNTRTPAREAAKKVLPPGAMPRAAGDGLRNTSAFGITADYVAKAINALRGGASRAKAERITADMAAMLTAQGAKTGEIVKALVEYNQSLGSSRLKGEQWSNFVRGVINATQSAAINNASQMDRGY